MQSIFKAIQYIENHLDDKLDLETLAKEAGYSKYHFCRIFQTYTGENITEYITRLRLQKASIKIADKNKNLLNIAFECGYQSQSGFIRAFEKMFSNKPKVFRKEQERNFSTYKENLMNSYEIVTREDIWVVYERALGDYEQSIEKAWNTLKKEATIAYAKIKNNDPSFQLCLTFDNSEVIGICYDNPDTTEADKIRYEACVSADKNTAMLLNKYGMKTKKISGGKYAKFTCIGDSDKDIWLGFYKLVCDDKHIIKDEPPFEKYLNDPGTTPIEDLKLELYINIE